jgi:hypothetical protein
MWQNLGALTFDLGPVTFDAEIPYPTKQMQILDWLDKGVLHGKIRVLQTFPFALHTGTCQFSVLHQSTGMLYCVCAHKCITSSFILNGNYTLKSSLEMGLINFIPH